MTGPVHILVVEKNPATRKPLVQTLRAESHFLVEHAVSASDALARAEPVDHLWSAIVVDAPLPDCEVAEFCALLQRRGLRVPILVVSDAMEEQEVVRALDAGAIDYMSGPVRPVELIARLCAHIRQNDWSGNALLMIGPYRLNPAERTLDDRSANLRLRLTRKEVNLLTCLYRAAGTAVSREALLREVWAYNPGSRTHTVETHIYRLRNKIERNPASPSIIVTGGGGYCVATSE